MEKHVLSKSTFIRGTQCLKSLYLNKKHPYLRDRLPDSQRAVFKRGSDMGVLAQQLFPNGINLRPRSASQFSKRATETVKIINTHAYDTLYEAVFQFDRLLAILDILVKGNQGWVACEVKSSTKISQTYLTDAAFQYYVITHGGVSLEDFFLVYINKDYVFDGILDLEKLFIKQSVFSEVIERQEFVKKKVEEEKQTLLRASSPEINIGPWCHDPYPCDFLGHCWKNVEDNSILHLDAFEEKERFELYLNGKDNPGIFESDSLTGKQKIQVGSARTRRSFVDATKLPQGLSGDALIFSPYFVKVAVPCLVNTHPYQLVPVACGTRFSSADTEITFFIREKNAIELFISYFRNIIENHSKIIIYDKNNLLDFLNETDHHWLAKVAEEKWIELSQVFRSDALFDFRLKGNYSPQNVAQVFLKRNNSRLDPSLLNMNWQMALLTGSAGNNLLENTHDYINYLTDFQYDFMNWLINTKSGVPLQNK